MFDVAPIRRVLRPGRRRRTRVTTGRLRDSLTGRPTPASGARAAGAVVACCALAAAGVAAAPASAATGVSASTGAGAGGAVAPRTRLHLTVMLRPRDPRALAAYANAVATPGSPVYRRYLTPNQFGRRFGAAATEIARVRTALARHGLTLGRPSAGRLSLPVTTDAATVQHALHVQLRRVAARGGGGAVTSTSAPAIPASVAADVESIVGLRSSAAPAPLARRRPAPGSLRAPLTAPGATATTTGTATTATGTAATATAAGPRPCAAASQAGGEQGGYTDDQIAAAYGFDGLYGAGDTGAGVTVAVYELEPDDPSDIAAYEACYGIATPISYVHVDGGAGRGAGSDEAALDIENLIGFAPGIRVIVYQGPNAKTGAPGSGPFDTFAKIVNQDRAQVVSVSWGGCESQLGRANARAENLLFEQAAVQGQSIIAADGDSGAQDCHSASHPRDERLAVDDPASQPWVTGVGGSSMQGSGPPPYQTVWNSTQDLGSPPSAAGASGGGVSSFWAMPPAQSHAARSLSVVSAAAGGPHCGRKRGYCREVPDVSASADPNYGYLIYWNGTHAVTGASSGWQVLGGTSGAAPVWAALVALADASPTCAGHPIGFANPALYRAASTAYGSDFTDITQGDNDFAVPGQGYGARRGYDLATGLGTPHATALAASLCQDTLTVDPVSARRTPVHRPVSLRLHAADVPRATLKWSQQGLPPGLKLSSDGHITGRATKTGRYLVRATARDGQGATASVTFTWRITDDAA